MSEYVFLCDYEDERIPIVMEMRKISFANLLTAIKLNIPPLEASFRLHYGIVHIHVASACMLIVSVYMCR